jgi:hypothetical protein
MGTRAPGTPRQKNRYSDEVKEQIRLRYPGCLHSDDRKWLAAQLGVIGADGEPDVARLYNAASRSGGARKKTGPASERDDLEAALAAARAPERLLLRDDPAALSWDDYLDGYVRRAFGKLEVELIALFLDRTETAVLHRARQLGLRRHPRGWSLEKAAAWLALDPDELREAGITFLLGFPDGSPSEEVVDAKALAARVSRQLRAARDRGADLFFLAELADLCRNVRRSQLFESCQFLSAAHVCANPYAGPLMGLFCTNSSQHAAGENPNCLARGLELADVDLRRRGRDLETL